MSKETAGDMIFTFGLAGVTVSAYLGFGLAGVLFTLSFFFMGVGAGLRKP